MVHVQSLRSQRSCARYRLAMAGSIRSISRDGTVLRVDDTGKSGNAILFQHGLGGDATEASEIFPEQLAMRRLTLECRGHGSSQSGDHSLFSIATFASDVAALAEQSRSAPLVIAGVSMGAAIALRLACRRPDLVRGLVLVRPAWLTEPAPCNLVPVAEAGLLLSSMAADEAKARFLGSETATRLADDAPDNLLALTSFFDRRDPKVMASLMQAISKDGPGVTTEEISAIRVPTLTIGNCHDFLHPIIYAKRLSKLIPGARFAEVTSKSCSAERHISDCRSALFEFLQDLT
jgi:pimeloyl-ACP methyl ester carboxylesterase